MSTTGTRETIAALTGELSRLCAELGRQTSIMEVCGTHTVSLYRSGVRSLLPEGLRLISGPGCPVCVTSQGYIDAAIALAGRDSVTIATYGDMVRVPGNGGSLESARAEGADVRVVYSARQAIALAERHPDREVVFLAIGFETTAPATADAILSARAKGLTNFSVMPAHKQVVPAMVALLEAGDVLLDGFMCPGHVSVIIGSGAYRPVADRYGLPCVVAGFEPGQMLEALVCLLRQRTEGRARVENVYPVAVCETGNSVAVELMERVFRVEDARWRAMGTIPVSGLGLREELSDFDAFGRFGITLPEDRDPPGCRCGDVIQGKATPGDCPLFGSACTPRRPIGPCMVSSEGTCAALYKYRPVESAGRSPCLAPA
ncbi:MAG: hydrogenase formation protein HypD [Phycisphaerae bacterium]|nr:hydrogenase formation protein HypD [Phycisphaerae bacterium]